MIEPRIITVNITKEGVQHFEFTGQEEATAETAYIEPCTIVNYCQGGCHLYEPNKSISKGGAFKLASQRFGICKVSPATHLYFSEGIKSDFPGKCFRIIEGAPFNKRTLGEWKKKYPRASVSAKNFPLTSEELAKRLCVKEDDRLHIFGFTAIGGEKYLFCTERVQ